MQQTPQDPRPARPRPGSASGRRVVLDEIDAAAHINRSPATLRSWRSRKQGPPYLRIGGSIGYDLADLDRWLDAHRVEPAAAA